MINSDIWAHLDRILNAAFDLYLRPFDRLSALWLICALALPSAVIALLVFRWLSDQDAILATKNKVKAHLLELRLYQDDLRMVLRAQRAVLGQSFLYARHALIPMLVMLVPFTIVVIQVESRLAYRSMHPGESVVVVASVDDVVPISEREAALRLPHGLTAETPALRVDATGEVLWRIRAVAPGEHSISIILDGRGLERRLVVGENPGQLSPYALREDDPRLLLYTGEPPIDRGAMISATHVDYPRARAVFAGLSSAAWTWVGVSILLAYLLRGVFRVTF